MTFDKVLSILSAGGMVYRHEWSPGTFLKGTEDVAKLYVPGTGFVTWSPRQVEVFATDWEIMDQPPTQNLIAEGLFAARSMGEN